MPDQQLMHRSVLGSILTGAMVAGAVDKGAGEGGEGGEVGRGGRSSICSE